MEKKKKTILLKKEDINKVEDTAIKLIGISTHGINPHRFVFSLNKHLEFEFIRLNDLVHGSSEKTMDEYPLFLHVSELEQLRYFLIGSQGLKGHSINLTFGYFLWIEGSVDRLNTDSLCEKIGSIENIFDVFSLSDKEIADFPNFQFLLEDLELYFLELRNYLKTNGSYNLRNQNLSEISTPLLCVLLWKDALNR